jgi:glycosyltransferase involved in cell wall biosynthesis
MKLLVVSNMFPSKAAPGYGTFVQNFCHQLEALGIGYDLAVMKKSSGKLGKIAGYVGFYAKSFFGSLFGRYDAVYVHYTSHSSAGVLLARKFRKFTVYSNCHGSDVIPQNSRQEKMQKNTRAILACSQKVVVPSEYFRQVVTEKYGIPAEKVYVCASGGVDDRLFTPARTPEDTFTIGFVSRLIHGKGWNVLLDACAKLPDPDFRLLIVGGGEQTEALKNRLDELGLADRAEVTGSMPQEKLPALLNRMDVFVFPTELSESLGLVAIEAMACGTPVIVSDHAAPGCYVRQGENGYKFPVGDAQKLAEAITAFRALSQADRQQLTENGLATARDYTRERVTQALGNILLE